MLQNIWLVPIAVLIGAYGSFIGSGGGFALVPLLLLLYPDETPEAITAISLSVVFIEAVAASLAYARMRRIEYRAGILLAIPTIPGAVLGAETTFFTNRHFFDALFGAILIAEAFYLMTRRNAAAGASEDAVPSRGGETSLWGFRFPFDWRIGVTTSFLVGYVSSLLGIGGGLIHIPIMVRLLKFPIKTAAATSLFIIMLRALAGIFPHYASGSVSSGVPQIACLAVGIFAGAQIGAYISGRLHSRWIVRGLAVALVVVGIKILAAAAL